MTDKKPSVRTADLFDCDVPYISGLFDKTYPWEILPDIRKHVEELIATGIEGFVEIRPGVLVGRGVNIAETAVIEAPAVIGSDSEIRPGAYIRGSVITGPRCVIGNSTELKNCVLLRRVQVPHYNYVGDSILGNGSHLGAGAICSNLKSDGKNVIVRCCGEKYETGLRKVGSFIGDGADIGCGCVLNPGTVVGKRTSVYPLTPLRGVYSRDCIVKTQTEICQRV